MKYLISRTVCAQCHTPCTRPFPLTLLKPCCESHQTVKLFQFITVQQMLMLILLLQKPKQTNFLEHKTTKVQSSHPLLMMIRFLSRRRRRMMYVQTKASNRESHPDHKSQSRCDAVPMRKYSWICSMKSNSPNSA